MRSPTPDTAPLAVTELRSRVHGEVIGPTDAGYDTARALFYRALDRRPAAIVRPVDTQDVARVVRFARDSDVELGVRSGGHSIAGHSVSDGGLTLDLSAMRALLIDAERRQAWADTGLTAGEYTAATGEYGLGTGFGDSPTVGIGGITLGGGVGYLHRKHGLTIDNLLAAEVVTADGEVLHVDPSSHPDLFWALRGGGGNFGVATRFQYRLHEVDSVVGGMLVLPATPASIAAFLAEADAAPEELSGVINVMTAPPMPFLAAEHHGRPIILAILVFAGAADAARLALAPLRSIATPIADLIEPMRYPSIFEGGGPHPVGIAVRSLFADSVGLEAAEGIIERLQSSTAPMRVAQFRVLGGAVARVPADATAFAHRDRRMMANVAAAFDRPEDRPEHEAWASAFAAELRQGEGAYVGFLGNEGPTRVREAYPGATWERLARVKARYDPTNFFRLNQNVPPAPVPEDAHATAGIPAS